MTAAEELTKLYEEAQKRLVEIVQRKALGGSPAVYERNILKQVTVLLKKLKKATPEVVQQMVLDGYKTGLESAVEDILKAEIPTPSSYNLFSRVHTAQINLIVQNTVDSLTKAVNIVGRRMQDEIRDAGLRATAMKTATGGTVREMQKDLEQRLLGLNLRQQNGRLGVKYKNRKIVPLDKYAAMVSRTTPAEAQNKAKIVQAAEWGYDLVRCTTHAPTCEICAQYQGRVYALTREAANGKYKGPNGEPLRFPLLYETALVHGYETIHPNCRHRFTVLPARAYSHTELAEMSHMSMRPFEDTRSDAERKAYAKEQAVKRARNDDLREWRRYRAALPDQAPATFAGFRSMKRANSQRYQDLKADYRYITGAGYVEILDKQFSEVKGSTETKCRIEKELSMLPEHHRKILDETVEKIILTDDLTSAYSAKLRTLRINRAFEDGDLIHESAHVLEQALGFEHNEEFQRLLRNTFQSVPLDDIIIRELDGRSYYFAESPKFVSNYQGRLYDTGGEGILQDGIINLKAAREYFSEGYRVYFQTPMILAARNPELYSFIERLVENAKGNS